MTYDDSAAPNDDSSWPVDEPDPPLDDLDSPVDDPDWSAPTSADWEEFLDVAVERIGDSAGTTLTPGLGIAELTALEDLFGTALPIEVGLFLRRSVPVSTDPTRPRWYDWRAAPEQQRERFEAQIRSGIVFDVRHNRFWAPPWGSPPTDVEERVRLCQQQLAGLPRLFPLFGHRGIAVDPAPGHDNADGNPVFSVHQTDVIYYGFDLADWMHQEFGVPKPSWVATSPRRIPFWSDLATGAWR